MIVKYEEIIIIWEVQLNYSTEYGSPLYNKRLKRLAKLTQWEEYHREKRDQIKWSFN